MVRAIPEIAKPIITSADIVDALVGIRDELAGGIAPVFVIPRIWELVGRIEVDAATAAEQIAASLPRISGGAPESDGCEDDAEGWPDSFEIELDSIFWNPTEPQHQGETPLSVLAESVPFNGDYDAWLDRLDAAHDAANRWTEADQVAAHGCA